MSKANGVASEDNVRATKPDHPKTVSEKSRVAGSDCSKTEVTTMDVALVVDDEPANRDFLLRLLEQAKLTVHGASTAAEACAIASQQERIDLLVVDNKLPDNDGVDLMSALHEKHPNACVVMATMLDERALMAKAFENGCDVFLVKPHGFMELFRRIQVMKTTGENTLKCMVIDQYGPRPYRG